VASRGTPIGWTIRAPSIGIRLCAPVRWRISTDQNGETGNAGIEPFAMPGARHGARRGL
jgi:hypothetical protein